MTWQLRRDDRPDPLNRPTFDDLSDRQKAEWFGRSAEEMVEDSEELIRAWLYLTKTIPTLFSRKQIGKHAGITGLRLMQSCLPCKPNGNWYVYEQLPDPVIAIIKSNSHNHRRELIHPTANRIVLYDMRDAYASLLTYGLPTVIDPTDLIRDKGDSLIDGHDGFYRCVIRIPTDWHHIGLIPVKVTSGWMYPRQPGHSFHAWVSDYDCRMLDKYGWHYQILERLIFSRNSTARPLLEFSRRFTPWLEAAERAYKEKPTLVRSYIRNALRNMVNHAIGCMHSPVAWRDVPIEELENDPDILAMRSPDGDLIAKKEVLHSPFRARWYKPEWSSAVYRNEFRRVTLQALQVPFETILGFNGDGIFLSEDPGWADTTEYAKQEEQQKIGVFRLKADKPIKRANQFKNFADLTLASKGH